MVRRVLSFAKQDSSTESGVTFLAMCAVHPVLGKKTALPLRPKAATYTRDNALVFGKIPKHNRVRFMLFRLKSPATGKIVLRARVLPASMCWSDPGHQASPARGNRFANTIHRPTKTADWRETQSEEP
jgi:hypothetical protein